MPNYDSSELIESGSLGLIVGTGTLADEANDGPIVHGTFREVYHELHMVEVDDDDNEYVAYSALGYPLYQFKPDSVMPPMVAMTPEQEAFAEVSQAAAAAAAAALRKSQQLERLAIARRQRNIDKGQRKLDKFRASKHGGGHRKSRRMRNITRRRHCK